MYLYSIEFRKKICVVVLLSIIVTVTERKPKCLFSEPRKTSNTEVY